MRSLPCACIALLLSLFVVATQAAANRASAVAHAGRAAQLMQDRRYGEAAEEFEHSLAADPDNDAVRIQYATCLFAQERNDEARKQFEIEVRRLGERPGLNYYLGRLDIRANDFTAAVRRLQPLSADPGFPKAPFYLGVAYLSAGQPARALESLERAARNNPTDPEVHYKLGRVYTVAERIEDANREFEIYRKVRETQRFVEEASHACMDALRTQPIFRAREVCQRIADLNDSRRMLLLGQLYAGSGAFGEAVEPLRVAVKLDPGSFDAWHNLGRSLFWLKRYQEAVLALQKAASLNPDFFDTLNLLAASLHALGADAAALPILERAHTLNPGDAGVTSALERLRATRKENTQPR
jgi:tetratricopeptide (TPR) repeat protein